MPKLLQYVYIVFCCNKEIFGVFADEENANVRVAHLNNVHPRGQYRLDKQAVGDGALFAEYDNSFLI